MTHENDVTNDLAYETPIKQVRAIMNCLDYLAEEARQQEFLFLRELILSASRCAADIAHGAVRGNGKTAKTSKTSKTSTRARGAKTDGCG